MVLQLAQSPWDRRGHTKKLLVLHYRGIGPDPLMHRMLLSRVALIKHLGILIILRGRDLESRTDGPHQAQRETNYQAGLGNRLCRCQKAN